MSAWDFQKRISSPMGSSTGMADLIQNCDLPPPHNHKLFAPHGNHCQGRRSSSRSRSLDFSDAVIRFRWVGEGLGSGKSNSGELLRALQLSQSRAREAEAKTELLKRRSEEMMTFLQQESLRLLAHQQLVRLLSVEIGWLEDEKNRWESSYISNSNSKEEDHCSCSDASWYLGLAMCMVFAGIGFFVGYTTTQQTYR